MTQRTNIFAGLLAVGALVGILALSAARFVAQPLGDEVHYHANWAIFVDGERLDLTHAHFMEDVAQCRADPTRLHPEDRVHMHEGNHDVVHVHHAGATWGHLLINLGFGIGDDYLYTERGRHHDAEEGTLKFVLNGAEVASIRNRVIGDEDRLLISYGPEAVAEVLERQFPHVASNAGEYNHEPDPASCAGPAEVTLGERIRRAVWF
jgi:hypothetical protein